MERERGRSRARRGRGRGASAKAWAMAVINQDSAQTESDCYAGVGDEEDERQEAR